MAEETEITTYLLFVFIGVILAVFLVLSLKSVVTAQIDKAVEHSARLGASNIVSMVNILQSSENDMEAYYELPAGNCMILINKTFVVVQTDKKIDGLYQQYFFQTPVDINNVMVNCVENEKRLVRFKFLKEDQRIDINVK